MELSLKALLFLFAISFLAKAHHDTHTCTHGKEDHGEVELHDVDEDLSSLQEGRILAQSSSSYPNMRLYASYDALSSAPSEFKAYVQNKLAPPVLDWFSGALRVKYPVSGLLKVTDSKVCDVKTPSELKNGVYADYAIVYDHRYEKTSTVASSRACTRATGTKRPIVARTNFNRYMFEATDNVIEHEKNMYLLIHEMMHTFGFSDNHYPYFLDANGNTLRGHIKSAKLNGRTSVVIDVAPLTEKLRNYYGCPNLPGVYMENDGGDGTAASHLERKLFVYEAMCSGGIYGRRVSEFSLAFLEGSGWYAPDYSYAEPFFFGQGQGCDFVTGSSGNSEKFEEYCSGGDRGCAPQGMAGGKCDDDSKSNGFKYFEPKMDYHCENPGAEDSARLPAVEVFGRGAGSKCFTGTLATSSSKSTSSYCFKYNCLGSGEYTQLEIQLGNNRVVCTREGTKSVDGYDGYINCPDPLAFCNTVGLAYCPRNCMNRGTCVNDKCVCNSGFTGVDCGLYA